MRYPRYPAYVTSDIDASGEYPRHWLLKRLRFASTINPSKSEIGYEIPFNRYFYKYVPPRDLEEIDTELQTLGREIMELLAEVVE